MPCDASLSESACNELNEGYELYKIYSSVETKLTFEEWRAQVEKRRAEKRGGADQEVLAEQIAERLPDALPGQRGATDAGYLSEALDSYVRGLSDEELLGTEVRPENARLLAAVAREIARRGPPLSPAAPSRRSVLFLRGKPLDVSTECARHVFRGIGLPPGMLEDATETPKTSYVDGATRAWLNARELGDLLALSMAACRMHGIASALSVFRWSIDLFAPLFGPTLVPYENLAEVRRAAGDAASMLDRWADASCNRWAHPEFDGWTARIVALHGTLLGAPGNDPARSILTSLAHLIIAAQHIEAGAYAAAGLALRVAAVYAAVIGGGDEEARMRVHARWCERARREFLPPTLSGMVPSETDCETLALVIGVTFDAAAAWFQAGFDVGDAMAWTNAGYPNPIAARAAVEAGKRPWSLRRGRTS